MATNPRLVERWSPARRRTVTTLVADGIQGLGAVQIALDDDPNFVDQVADLLAEYRDSRKRQVLVDEVNRLKRLTDIARTEQRAAQRNLDAYDRDARS